jgi:selenophosphate synthase
MKIEPGTSAVDQITDEEADRLLDSSLEPGIILAVRTDDHRKLHEIVSQENYALTNEAAVWEDEKERSW